MRVLIASLIALGLTGHQLRGQNRPRAVAVSLEVDGAEALKGCFAAALRSLGDVQIVSLDDEPDVVLRILVVCDKMTPDSSTCADPNLYAVAIDLLDPF